VFGLGGTFNTVWGSGERVHVLSDIFVDIKNPPIGSRWEEPPIWKGLVGHFALDHRAFGERGGLKQSRWEREKISGGGDTV